MRPLRAGLHHEAPALLVVVAAAVVHLVVLLLAHGTYFAEHDNSLQFWAWYQKAAAALHSGSLPLWDVNTLAGHSFVGETQTGVFYPLNLVWLLLFGSDAGIGTRALDGLIEAHLLIASLGFYALVRSLAMGRLTAVVSALVFADTGVVFGRSLGQTAIFFGLTLIPWAMFFAHRWVRSGHWLAVGAAGGVLGLSILAGHFQPALHGLIAVTLVYLLAPTRMGRTVSEQARSRGLAAVLTLGCAALVALPQVAYSLPYLGRAFRFVGTPVPIPPGGQVSYATFSRLYDSGPHSALSLLDPQAYTVPDNNELFIGIAPLLVLAAALLLERRRVVACLGGMRLPVLGCLVLGALAMLGPWTPFPRILYALPFVAQVRELPRYSILVHLGLCLLLAAAVESLELQQLSTWLSGHRFWRVGGWLIAGGLTVEGLYLIGFPAPSSTGWFGVQLLLGAATLLVLLSAHRVRGAVARGALALLLGAAALHNGTRLVGDTSSPVYPARAFARTPAISYAENACAGHRILILQNVWAANIGDVFRRMRTVNGYGATMERPFYEFITASSQIGPEQTRLLDVRCIVAPRPTSLPGYRLGFADRSHGAFVYVDPRTSPVNTVTLQPVAVSVEQDGDRRQRYAVRLARPEVLVVSAIVSPGWELTLDGRRVSRTALRVHGAAIFPQIAVPAGAHTIEYRWPGWPA